MAVRIFEVTGGASPENLLSRLDEGGPGRKRLTHDFFDFSF
jgi:hypothetical protein